MYLSNSVTVDLMGCFVVIKDRMKRVITYLIHIPTHPSSLIPQACVVFPDQRNGHLCDSWRKDT